MIDLARLLRDEPIVTLAVIDDPGHAVGLARALRAGGLQTLEVALRTDASISAIAAIAAKEPDVTLLAGTVLSVAQAEGATAAGARALVSPGFSPTLSRWAAQGGVPYIPGVATATDITAALDHGHRLLKFFPAAQLGGFAMLAALAAPFATAGVSFLLSGGMTEADVATALQLPYVAGVGGTWIAPSSRVRAQEWDSVTLSARSAREIADIARPSGVG